MRIITVTTHVYECGSSKSAEVMDKHLRPILGQDGTPEEQILKWGTKLSGRPERVEDPIFERWVWRAEGFAWNFTVFPGIPS